MSSLMGIKNVLAALLPSYETNKLESSVERNTSVLTTKMLPEIQQLQEILKTPEGGTFASEDMTKLSDDIVEFIQRRGLTIPGLKKATVLEYVANTIQNLSTISPFIQKELRVTGGKTLLTDGLSFNRKTLLQLVDMIDFFATYISILINYVTAEEVAKVTDTNIDVENVGPNDLQYLRLHHVAFAIVIRVLGTPLAKLKADYAEIPDVIFDEGNYDEMVQAWGTEKVDPMGMMGVPFPLSMVLRARIFFADRAMDKYDECVAASKLAQMRIALYRKRLTEAGREGDAGLERMIENLEKELTKLKRERERMEKKLNLTDLVQGGA